MCCWALNLIKWKKIQEVGKLLRKRESRKQKILETMVLFLSKFHGKIAIVLLSLPSSIISSNINSKTKSNPKYTLMFRGRRRRKNVVKVVLFFEY